jgi:hypothetical protein
LFAKQVRHVMEQAPGLLKTHFDIDFALPLKVDIKIGPNWGEMKELIV